MDGKKRIGEMELLVDLWYNSEVRTTKNNSDAVCLNTPHRLPSSMQMRCIEWMNQLYQTNLKSTDVRQIASALFVANLFTDDPLNWPRLGTLRVWNTGQKRNEEKGKQMPKSVRLTWGE